MALLSLLSVLAALVAACLGFSEEFRFELEPSREATVFSKRITVNGIGSLLSCAGLCSARRDCLTFRFHKAERQCQLSDEEPGGFGSGVAAFSAKRRLQRADLGKCRYLLATPDGRRCCPIQQRLVGSISFQRLWDDYEIGFGDATDFWIGLQTIHQLSSLWQTSGTQQTGGNFLVDQETMSGETLHQEYFNFVVLGPETNYTMLVGKVHLARSDFFLNTLKSNNASQFSTMDRDNDIFGLSCSVYYHGSAGWWFKQCSYDNPNGIYMYSANVTFTSERMHWLYNLTIMDTRAMRLLLVV